MPFSEIAANLLLDLKGKREQPFEPLDFDEAEEVLRDLQRLQKKHLADILQDIEIELYIRGPENEQFVSSDQLLLATTEDKELVAGVARAYLPEVQRRGCLGMGKETSVPASFYLTNSLSLKLVYPPFDPLNISEILGKVSEASCYRVDSMYWGGPTEVRKGDVQYFEVRFGDQEVGGASQYKTEPLRDGGKWVHWLTFPASSVYPPKYLDKLGVKDKEITLTQSSAIQSTPFGRDGLSVHPAWPATAGSIELPIGEKVFTTRFATLPIARAAWELAKLRILSSEEEQETYFKALYCSLHPDMGQGEDLQMISPFTEVNLPLALGMKEFIEQTSGYEERLAEPILALKMR